jgi:hypothetical protein
MIPSIINGGTSEECNKYTGHKFRNDLKQKLSHKIVIIGDSHARGCAGYMKLNLKGSFVAGGNVKPGTFISMVSALRCELFTYLGTLHF